ncbi:hypothetical protein C0Q88_07270 [Ralstonia pickettii]|uniref:HTH cro/C1-type domain-containing protein n=2 Tax=Ralstonia pickettii TaxID=329 RepID=A0A2N4TXN3_RALPI|nr:hypothetical protein C0Q88_07270 [Ralstonia pickettii]
MSFRERLKALMSAKQGATLAAIAEACGCTPQAVHKWLRGGDITYVCLKRLAIYFNVNWVWLRYGEKGLEDIQGSGGSQRSSFLIERSQCVERIVESERLLRLALEVADVGAWEIDVITGRMSYSATARRMLALDGDRSEDLHSFCQLLVESDAARLEKALVDVLRDGATLDILVQSKADRKIWFELSGGTCEHTLAQNGRVMGVLKIVHMSDK